MANTYTQLYVQFVFAVKGRDKCIPPIHREEIHKYITAIVASENQKMLAILCMPDHIHIFIGFTPEIKLSELVRKIKTESTNFINKKDWMPAHFEWQEGYGAFSYGRSQKKDVIQYLLNQEEKHRAKTFKEEYLGFLEKFEVQYDERYLFDFD